MSLPLHALLRQARLATPERYQSLAPLWRGEDNLPNGKGMSRVRHSGQGRRAGLRCVRLPVGCSNTRVTSLDLAVPPILVLIGVLIAAYLFIRRS